MKALLMKAAGDWNETAYIDDIPKPVAGDGQVLVKVEAAAINPADYGLALIGAFIPKWPYIFGFDVSGVVEQVGSGVTEFKVGDEVFGMCMGGGFAEYVATEAKRLNKKPSNISFAQASTLATACRTALVSLFGRGPEGMGLHRVSERHIFEQPEWILIMGGATCVGMFAIQLAKMAGHSVITTASKKNHEYLKSLGATHTIDYTLPSSTQTQTITSLTHNTLRLALDCVSANTAILAGSCLNTSLSPILCGIANPGTKLSLPGVEIRGEVTGLSTEDLDDVKSMYVADVLPAVERGEFKCSPVVDVEGGLEEVKGALDRLRDKRVSMGKQVVVARF
ncbi:hypothetical protein HDV00_004829 [Rhizophlyctis rosea]|nr:hypothetical protein HDV00_004829 [Rhizophlyctis rosea]